MGVISVAKIRESLDRKEELFDVPEFGEGAQIKLRMITLAERDQLVAEGSVTGKVGGAVDPVKMGRLLLRIGIEEPKLTAEDVEHLATIHPWGVLDRIVQRVLSYNGMTGKKGEVEKNSDLSF